MKSRFRQMVYLGIRQLNDPYYQGFAAQLSFFLILSLVPTIIVLSQLLGFLDIPVDYLKSWIEKYVTSNDMTKVLQSLLAVKRSYSATAANIIMIIMALWAASRAQFSLMRIANYTYTSGRTTGNFWTERIRSLGTMVITLFTVVFVITVLVYGKMILVLIFGQLIEGSAIDTIWTYLRWPVAMALYFLMVSYIYYVLPVDKLSFKEIVPGSIFGSVGMLVVTVVYSAYATYSVNYDIIYGSLSSIVALMFWFYFLAWALTLGILFNKVWRDTKNGGNVYDV